MNLLLWVVQTLLALAFVAAGSLKATRPIAALSRQMPWTGQVPAPLVRGIGLAELLGGLGLVLPLLLGIQPWLTPLAAAGLVLVMLLAVGFHLLRGEVAGSAPSLVLGLLAALVVYGRATALGG